MNLHRLRLSVISVLTVVLFTGSAVAQKVTLRVADSFPVSHYLVQQGIKPWMDEVTRRTDGEVQFEYYPGQQLGKAADILKLVQSGVADIGYVGPSYVSDRMPLSEVVALPGFYQTSCEGTRAYWQLVAHGVIGREDYARNNVHPLYAVTLDPYQMFTRSKRITNMGDLSGLKLRSAGGAMDIMARKLGIVPVRMAAPDAYESLSRGTLDGLIFPYDSVLSYDLQGLVKFGTRRGSFGSFVVSYVMSDKSWNKLSDKAKQAIDAIAESRMSDLCTYIDHNVQASVEKLQAAGVTFNELDAGSQKEMSAALADVAGTWAKGLDERGRPGTETLQAFRASLTKH